jgi:cytochrome c peroxidase
MEKFDVHGDYWTLTKSLVHDEELFEASKNEADKSHFRVLMLLNKEKTVPYFNDGPAQDPKVAVRDRAKLQLDQELDNNQVESVVVFL